MVDNIKSILQRYPKQAKNDVHVILEYLSSYPESHEALLLLNQYPVDFFHADKWEKAHEVHKYYFSIGKETPLEPEIIKKPQSQDTQRKTIDAFLKIDIPSFLN